MKRTNHPQILLAVFVLLTLLLAACVRPVPTPDVSPVPTAIPQPTQPVATAVPPAATTQPGGETGYPGQENTPVPQPTAVPTNAPGTSVDPNTGRTVHTIQPGDTLFSIAQRYGTTVDAIVIANGIANPNNVPVGTQLVIPAPGEVVSPPTDGGTTPGGGTGETIHVVQAGENLFRIGLRYGFTAAELAAYNGIPDPTRIYVGQQIRIPPR